MQPCFGRAQHLVRLVAEFAHHAKPLGQGRREPLGQGQHSAQGCTRLGALGFQQPALRLIGQVVDPHILAALPVRTDLQDRRTAEAAMGEQRRLAERRLAAARHHVGRNARQLGKQRILAAQRQRYQRRTRLDHLEPELAGELIGKGGGPQLGDRGPAGRNHQCGRACPADVELSIAMLDRAGFAAKPDRDTATLAFLQQHGDDLLGRTIAEQLSQRLLVPGDVVAIDQLDEVRRGVARQRRLGEMRVGRKVAVGRGVDIGKVAPPAAGDQDLAANFIIVIEQQHPPSALAGGGGAEQPGGAGTEDDGVVFTQAAATSLAASASATLIPSTAAERMPPA